MYQQPHNPVAHCCNCGCPTHDGKPRRYFTDPGSRCAVSCTSQPLTVLSPQTGAALFLDQQERLWHVQSLGPAQWDWNSAIHSDAEAGYLLIAVEAELADLLRLAAGVLRDLEY